MKVRFLRPFSLQPTGSLLVLATLACFLFLSVTSSVMAQRASRTNREARNNEPPATRKRTQPTVRRINQSPAILTELQKKHGDLFKIKKAVVSQNREPLQGNEDALNKWYLALLVAMCRAQEGVEQIRLEFLKDLKSARRNDVRVFLRNFWLTYGPQVLAGTKVNVAAKVNTMLIVGELNQVEARRSGTNASPPVPLPAARRIMLEEVKRPEASDAVKVAALVGLRRHVEAEMVQGGARLNSDRQAGTTQIVQEMLRLLKSAPPAASSRVAGHYWMQRRALEILGLLGNAVPNGEITAAMDQLIAAQTAPMWLRCAAVEAMGRLTFSGQTQLNADETVKRIGSLALDSCHAEVERLQAWEKEEEEKLARDDFGRGSFRRRRDLGRTETFQEPGRGTDGLDEPIKGPGYEVILAARRRLKHELGCVQAGLAGGQGKGVRALAGSGSAATLIDQIDMELKTLLASLSENYVEPSDLRKKIATGAKRLASRLAGGPAGAASGASPDQKPVEDPLGDPFG